MFSQLSHLTSDPLDVLLFALGLRLTQLSKSNDEKFKSLLENRNFTIQLGSAQEKTARYYSVKDGMFSQTAGEAENPTLTISFKDSMTGVKLLTKGDAAAFMTGIQKGDLKMSGDYSLLMWFNQISKFVVPKVPEQLKPVVEHAKPLLEKAMPMAQGLFAKVTSLLGGDHSGSKQSKYFNENNTKDVTNSADTDSKLDTLKAKAAELKEDVTDKIAELKTDAKDKLDSLKEEASEKLADVKTQASEKLDDAKTQVTDKLNEVKDTVTDKAIDLKAKAEDKVEDAKEKIADVKTDMANKAEDVKDTVTDKATDLKAKAEDKVEDAKEKIADVKTDMANKAEDVKDTVTDKATDLKAKAEDKVEDAKEKIADVKTDIKERVESKQDESQRPSIDEKLVSLKEQNSAETTKTTSQVLEAKHANEEVIASNVMTSAVKNSDSPITNITVTRHEHDTKASDNANAKPSITVQDKDGNAYKSK